MDKGLTIIACSNYREELRSVIRSLPGHLIKLAEYGQSCGKNNSECKEAARQLEEDAQKKGHKAIVLGCACNNEKQRGKHFCKKSPANCMELLVDKGLIETMAGQREYLLTAGWLKSWETIVKDNWAFNQEVAQEFFSGFADKARLLDTGSWGPLDKEKEAFTAFTGLPVAESKIGLDKLLAHIKNAVLEYELEAARGTQEQLELQVNQAASDYNFVLDVLSQITETKGREETIGLIMDIFMSLFAPKQIVFIYPDGQKLGHLSYPSGQVDITRYTKMVPMNEPVVQTGRDSFAVRIANEEKMAGAMFVDHVTFPENISQYQNLALVLAGLSMSVINNAEYITELKQVRNKLSNSRKNLTVIIESMRDAVIAANANGIIDTANAFAHQLLGQGKHALIGKNISYALKFYKDKGGRPLEIDFKGLAAKGMGLDLSGEDYYIMAKGTKKYVRAQVSPYVEEIQGGRGIIVLISDSTADVEANRELKISENNLRALYDSSDESIVLLGPDGRILMANKMAQAIARYVNGRAMIMGERVYDYIREEDKASFTNNFKRALGGEKVSFEKELDLSTKGKGWYLFSYTPVKDHNGQVNRVYYSQRDITRQKKTEILERNIEIAERSARVKQRFMANMSHEIRTPMTGVIGMTDMLLKTRLSKQQAAYAKLIQEASEGLLNLLNDILDLSKIESGTISLQPKLFSVKKVVEGVVGLYRQSAASKGLELSYRIENPGGRLLLADKNRYRQVLTNLLTNAIKYTEEGQVSIHVRVVSHGRGISKLHTRVRDTGLGISPEDKDQIFNAFTQIDSSISRTHDGAGLGLAICKELVALMGGKIDVDSTPGKGSVFSFSANVQVTDEKEDSRAKQQAREKEVPKGTRVLLAEDKKANRKVIGLMLSSLGCNVTYAEDGRQALEKFKKQGFDIVLLDIHMPKMDGISAFESMKASGRPMVPVIAFSADADEAFVRKLFQKGFTDYIAKPVVYDKLKTIISKHIE